MRFLLKPRVYERVHREKRKLTHTFVEEKRRKNPRRQIYIRQWKNQRIVKTIGYDTGFNLKCCCCLLHQSISTCQSIEKLTEEEIENYITISELTKSKDQKYYICYQCKNEIRKKRGIPKQERQLELLKPIPTEFKEKLESVVKFQKDSNIMPNKLESFLLKIIIPFI